MTRARQRRSRAGITSAETITLIATLFVLAAVLYPVFTKAKVQNTRIAMICYGNEKRLGLAFLQYAQDYDGHFPPAHRWNGVWISNGFADSSYENAIIPYAKTKTVFSCPAANSGERIDNAPRYIYNDLIAGAKVTDRAAVAEPRMTILAMDGDLPRYDIGHACTPDENAVPAQFDARGDMLPGRGATVRDAPLRHHGAAFYVFSDGHVKELPPDVVFFPPRANASPNHNDANNIPTGPDPAGNMTFDGKLYQATFHLR